MATPELDAFAVAASYNSLVRRIADREPAALAQLHRLLVHRVFVHVRARLDDTAAAATLTRAVFVEAWRLAPARRRYDDARAWLLAIADRRIAEHLRSRGRPASLNTGYDEHIGFELNALLRHSPQTPATGTVDPAGDAPSPDDVTGLGAGAGLADGAA